MIAARANRVTEGMLMAAANALANCSPIVTRGEGAVLPALGDIREVSKRIAVAVAKQAQAEGQGPAYQRRGTERRHRGELLVPALPCLPPDFVLRLSRRLRTGERR
ncbi:malic enzyme-like NAD(P)-binding protein [Pseudomonas aeruginosa]